MLSLALPVVIAGAPARELLFAAAPEELGCDRAPCVGWTTNFTCVNYPDFPGKFGPSCRRCINDPSLPDPDDPSFEQNCDTIFQDYQELGCDAPIKISDPPECCFYG